MTRSALHLAARRSDVSVLQHLLQTDKSAVTTINAYDNHGYTPLMYAVSETAVPSEVVSLLISHGASAHQVCSGVFEADKSVMALALKNADLEKVKLLVEAGAQLNYARGEGYGPLLDAMFGRNLARCPRLLTVIEFLIENNAVTDAITDYKESPLRVLSREGRFDGIKLLLAAGADESQLYWTSLMKAVALGEAADVERELFAGADLEARDWWKRTAFLIAVQTGDLEKVALLRDAGANLSTVGHFGTPAMFYAARSPQTRMLQWLINNGADPLQADGSGQNALSYALELDNIEAVRFLLGQRLPLFYQPSPFSEDFDFHSKHPVLSGIEQLLDQIPDLASALGDDRDAAVQGLKQSLDFSDHVRSAVHAISDARSSGVAYLLLSAGADPRHLSYETQRVMLGLAKEPDDFLLQCSRDEFMAARTRVFGATNPERMDKRFWLDMIRAGVNGYQANQLFEGSTSFGGSPVWCAQRFGQSISFLNDGRVVQIGGEHEDSYDPDFCIYNDVFVHSASGGVAIYGYPEATFPPTDFHSATVIDEGILVIGGLGYWGTRVVGETRVFLLNLDTLSFTRIETTGESPGWIYRHRAQKISPHELRVAEGKVVTGSADDETHSENSLCYVLDLRGWTWRREGLGLPPG
jgi:ankyrin repeat protein